MTTVVTASVARSRGEAGVPTRPSWRRSVLAMAATAIAVGVNVPLVYVVVRALEGGWTPFAAAVLTASTLRLALRTIALTAGVVALTVPLAVALAWLVTRTDLPLRRLWAAAVALPLVFPSYVAALTFVAAFGPRGLLQKALEPFGVERLPEVAYGFSGALLVLSLYTYPYIFLLVVAALRGLDTAVEEASRGLGRGGWRTFVGAVLPQLEPALLGGALLVALYTLSDFGAVSLVRYNTFTLAIYNAYQGLFDRSTAAALATVLVALTLGMIVLETLRAREVRPPRRHPPRPARLVALGPWRWPVLCGLAALVSVNLGAPCVVLSMWGARAVAAGTSVGPTLSAAISSVTVAAPAAAAAVCLSVPVVYWAVRVGRRGARLVLGASYSGYALPGMVVALALVFFSLRVVPSVYQTLGLVVAAYVVRFLPEAISATKASLVSVSPAFEEAGRSLGGSPLRVVRTVTLPLIRPGLVTGAGLVLLTTMKELPATLILRPAGFETLATLIWSSASDGVYSRAALPALVLLALTLPAVYFLVLRPGLREDLP
jgi:iron(III) transport system permease protein